MTDSASIQSLKSSAATIENAPKIALLEGDVIV